MRSSLIRVIIYVVALNLIGTNACVMYYYWSTFYTTHCYLLSVTECVTVANPMTIPVVVDR